MTAPISNSKTTAATPSLMTGSTKAATGSSNAMDKDMFLKLLVTQLKYQDPSNPSDPSAFMAQTAQFSMVEKISEVATAQQQMVSAQLMSSATNMVGRTVTYTGADGMSKTGIVTSATISGSNPTVKVGDTDVPLSSVKEVRNSSTTA